MKKIVLFSLIILAGYEISAQGFQQALGLRAGLSAGFEYRFYTNDANSFKFLLSTRDNGIQLHGLKEFHEYDLFSFSNQLNLIYGFGIHAGYERYSELRLIDNSRYYEERTSFIAGIDVLAGLEYIFQEVPVSLGIEVKPFLDVFGEKIFRIQPFDFAFTIKYLF